MVGRFPEDIAIWAGKGLVSLLFLHASLFASGEAKAQDPALSPDLIAAIREQAAAYDPQDYETPAEVYQIELEREMSAMDRKQKDFFERRRQLIAAGRCDDPTPEDYDVCDGSLPARSFGSIHVQREAAPFQAQVVFSDVVVATGILRREKPDQQDWERRHVCGGSLIAPDWVLTAAHCLQGSDPKNYAVRLDVDDISRSDAADIPLRRFIVNPGYCKRRPGAARDACAGKNRHDVALLQLDLSDIPERLKPEVVPLEDSDASAPSRIVSAHVVGDDALALVMQDRTIHRVSTQTGRRSVWLGSPSTEPIAKVWSGPGWIVRADQQGATLLKLDRDVRHRLDLAVPVAAAQSPGGRWFVAAGDDGPVHVMDTDRQGREARREFYLEPGFAVADLLFSSPDNLRVRSNKDQETVYNLVDGSIVQRLKATLPGSLIRMPEWMGTPREDTYVRGREGPPRRYFAQPGLQLIERRGEIFMQTANDDAPRRIGNTGLPHANLAASPNARWIAAMGPDGEMEIRSSRRFGRKYRTKVRPGFYDNPITMLRDNRRFMIWDPAGLSEIRSLPRGEMLAEINHGLPVTSIERVDGNRLLSYNNFGTVDLWGMQDGRALARVHHGDVVDGATVSGRYLLSWSKTGRVRLWDAATGRSIYHHLVGEDRDASSATDPRGLSLARVQTIPIGGETNIDPLLAETVTAFGWGKTASLGNSYPSARLRVLGLRPLRWEDCLARSNRLTPAAVDPDAFCAAGTRRKTCTGDSGGPVTASGRQVGIVSRGSGGCKADGEPTTFVMVGRYADWIRETICQEGRDLPASDYPICPRP